MTVTRLFTTATLVAALAAGSAFAKGHDQSQGADGEPGANAGSETAAAGQTLGAALGNGQDKSGMDRGNSGNAGKPSKD